MSLSIIEEYIETGNAKDLDLLLSEQPELVEQNTSHDISPLLLACYYHKEEVVKVLLKHTKSMTIHEACAAGLYQMVETMVKQSSELVDEVSSHGFTPLGMAAHFGKESTVRLLLRNYANPNIPSQNGYNVYPIHAALSSDSTEIVKMLIESGADVNVVQSSGITPLYLAAQQGNIELIILLLENGANIKNRTDAGLTASDIALEKGFREIGDILRF